MPNDISKLKAQLLEELTALRQQLENDDTRKKLALIQTIEAGLSEQLSLQEIYNLVGDKLQGYFDATSVLIAIYDQKTNLVQCPYYMEKGTPVDISPTSLGNSFSGHVIKTKKLLFFSQQAEILKMVEKLEMGKSGMAHATISKSYMGVPLHSKNQVNGMISLRNIDREGAFNSSDLKLLETLAISMSGALENARLFDETTQQNAELAVINSVQQGLAAQVDMQAIIDLVGDKLGEILKADVVQINIYDTALNQLQIPYCLEKGERHTHESRAPWGFRKHVIETGKSLVINEDLRSAELEFDNPVIAGEAPKSVAYVPLRAGDQVSGIISLQNMERENAIPTATVRLLETLAASMSVALENARLFDETTQRNAELAVINSVQHALAEELDLQGIYNAVGDKIREIFDAQSIIIVSFDTQAQKRISQYFYEKGEKYYPQPAPYTEFQKSMLNNGATVVINENMVEETKKYGMTSIIGDAPKSGIWTPYKVGSQVCGIISLQNIDREHAFPDSDVRLLETLAASMSVALENARLFDETTQRNAELAIINAVQQGLAKKIDLQGIVDLIGEKVGKIFKADTSHVGIYDSERDWLTNIYYVDRSERIPLPDWPMQRPSLIATMIDTRKPLLVSTSEEASKLGAIRILLTGEDEDKNESYMGVPIITGGQPIGLVAIQSYEKNAYDKNDLQLLATLASAMSVALENARLFDETQRLLNETEERAAELAVINSVQDGLVTKMDIQGIYDLVGDKIREIFEAHAVFIVAYDRATKLRHFPYLNEQGKRIYPEPRSLYGFSGQVIETGKPILISHDLRKMQLLLAVSRSEKRILQVPGLAYQFCKENW